MQTTPKISFCTTCMNRFEQLQAVLPKNVSILKKYGPEVELVVVNFIINEESLLIDNWIKQNFQEDLNANSFKYYTCLLYTSPSPRDATLSRMPSSA